MLNSILIRNIVLIDNLEINFKQNCSQIVANNFCILTGETGSGKSILLDALGLTIGYRSSNRLLKQGCKEGLVVAEFNIKNNPSCQEILQENCLINQENPDILILRRILLEGSSKAFVNDITIGVGLLAKIGQSLIEIHGQNQQNNLLEPAFHRFILDNYINNKTLINQVSQNFTDWQTIKKDLKISNDQKEQNAREQEYLRHIIKELQTAEIEVGEEETLMNEKNLISNQEKIINLLNETLFQVNQGDNNNNSAIRILSRNHNLQNLLNEKDNILENLVNILDEISTKNDQVKSLINNAFSAFNTNLNLEEIEERLFLIRSLARKFNTTIDNLPQFLIEAEEKLKLLENFVITSNNLEIKEKDLEKNFIQKANELSQIRKEAGAQLTKKIEQELAFLKMNSVKFAVKFEKLEEKDYNKFGFDKLRFTASTNASTNLDEINKIASGGELSRFMLALKVALLDVVSAPTLIFDEIDSGIGGAVANAVGERLKLLSKNFQILVVTHHPQIAAKANFHLKVQKTTKNNITKTEIAELNLIERQQEIARMLAAEELTDEAMAAAKKLME